MEKGQNQNKGLWKRFSWIGILLIGFLSKFKSIIPLLKLGKFGGTILSMGVSVFAYAYLYTWSFAIGLVVMIFIHEMGHVLAAKRKKLPVSAPAFIPFVGALITMKKLPQDAETEAYIAYGGPLFGTIGALACYGLGFFTGMEVFFVIALIGFVLNLFNLIPISPLDGGRIVVAISRWIWILGVILAFVLIIFTKSLLLIIIFALFAFEMWATRRQRSAEPREITHRLPVPTNTFTDQHAIVPGEKHQRELPMTHYCTIDERKEMLDIYYPGVGKIGRLQVAENTKGIERVQLVQTVQERADQLTMFVKVRYLPDTTKQDQYYQVTPMTRLKYGVAYFGLAALLIVMTVLAYLEIDQITL